MPSGDGLRLVAVTRRRRRVRSIANSRSPGPHTIASRVLRKSWDAWRRFDPAQHPARKLASFLSPLPRWRALRKQRCRSVQPSPRLGEAAERTARGGEGPTENCWIEFSRKHFNAARGIAHAACAPGARLTGTLTLILSLIGRGILQSSPEGEKIEE